MSSLIHEMLLQNKIKIYNVSLSRAEDVDKLYKLLILLASCNGKEFYVVYLFDNINSAIQETEMEFKRGIEITKKTIIDHYVIQWERLIENYFEKKDEISKLL